MDNLGDMENIESKKIESFKEEMGKAVAEMVRCHNSEIQMLNENHKHILEEMGLLNKNVIDTLAKKLEKERKYYCGQISNLKDDFEELKEAHRREIIDLKVSLEVKTKHKVNEIQTEADETIEQLKEQLTEQKVKFDEQMTKKSQFHTKNVENILRAYEVKRMKYISDLKSDFEKQNKAQAIELKWLTDETEVWKAQQNFGCVKTRLNQLKTEDVEIPGDLRQKLNQKLIERDSAMNSLDEQKIDCKNQLKISSNHNRKIKKLQSELKKLEQSHHKSTKRLKNKQNRVSELENKITELQNERKPLMNEVNQLRMNCSQLGSDGQEISFEIDRLKYIEKSHKYLAEQHPILYNKNVKLEKSHRQLEQSLTDKTKELKELQAFHKKIVDELVAKHDGDKATLNAKSVEIERLLDMQRVDDGLRNAAHQDEILNLIVKHQQELKSVRSEMERKIEEMTTLTLMKTEPRKCENCAEISNFKQRLEQVTKDSEMRENVSDRQIMDLQQELTSIRSKYSQLILNFEMAGNEHSTIAAANKALIEKQQFEISYLKQKLEETMKSLNQAEMRENAANSKP